MEKTKQTITKKKLKTLQSQLKELNMQWVDLLIEQMKKDKELEKNFRNVNDKKIYNVFNGIVKNGAWKYQIYRQAMILKNSLEAKMAEVV